MITNRTSYVDRFLVVRLALITLMVFGAFLVYFQTTAFFNARQSEAWPRTTGVLTVETGQYRKTLSYKYAVDGATYVSDRVIFGELGNRTRSKEWTAVSDSPSGSELDVYYSPHNPHESTLFTDLLPGSWFNLLLGFGFLMAGCITLIFLPNLIRMQKSAHPTAGNVPI